DQFGLTSTDWTTTASTSNYDFTFQYQDPKPFAYLYTDRPLYQPGQTIYFKGVVKQADNGRYAPADLKTVTVNLFGPVPGGSAYSYGKLQTFSLSVSDYGTFNASYKLPDTAVAGIYSFSVEESPNTYLNFAVEQYRKPEIDLAVTASAKDIIPGQDLQAKVTANYYFGAPAGEQSVQWTLSAASGYFPMSGGYQTGKQQWYGVTMTGANNYFGSDVIASGQDTTAADGTLDLDISASDIAGKLDVEQMQTLTLEVTMQDQSNLPVSARDTININPASYYIGVLPESWSVAAGKEIGFSILTVDWAGAVSGNHALVATFGQYDLVQTGTDPMSGNPTYSPKITPESSTNFKTDASGRARISFAPAHAGTYLLEVRGSDGAVTQWLVWVTGAGTASWPALPDQHIELTADAKQYQAGQTAHVLIPNPLNDGAVALISIERAKVMSTQVVTLSGSSYELALPLTEDDAPDVYVSVTIIGHDDNGTSSYQQGYVQLDVAPTAETLNVQLTASPQSGEPGGKETFDVKVTDSSGKPVQGEFSLALVDKALLALADPNSVAIDKAFYGIQPLGVQTNLALADYVVLLAPPLPGLGGGGAGGGMEVGTLRSNFQDTAYWNATIVTDVNGMATVSFNLPDNLTTWVATLRGLTQDMKAGEATTELVTSKPLLVRPETPNFLVAGDHVKLTAIVQNNTSQSLSVDVALAVKGVTLDASDQVGQKVQVPANGQQVVAWWATVDDTESVRLVFSASSGDLQDVTTPSVGDIPVLHYSVPQTYGTSGVLTDAGSRLELFSLPQSYKATGGELDVELSPSLAATVLSSMQALEVSSDDFTEPVVSRMQPDVAMLQAMNALSIENPDLKSKLEKNINLALDHLVATQNADGGWGWSGSAASDDYLTADVLFGLYQATQAGFKYDPDRLNQAANYLQATLFTPTIDTAGWQLDRLSFKVFVLATMGNYDAAADTLYDLRANLSPWGRALLALTENSMSANSDKVKTLVSDLEATGTASAAGISWPGDQSSWQNLDSAYFNTAVVAYALAPLDPAAPQLTNAVRYLAANRQPSGMWSSTFDTAWVLMALTQYLRNTGELQANFSYTATLNNAPLAKGQAGGDVNAMSSVTASVPANEMIQDSPNALLIQRDEGSGKLYYQAYLSVDKPAKDAQPLSSGVTITRDYYPVGQDCQAEECKPISSVQLANPSQEVQVRVTVTVPKEMYYLVVDDNIPAGAEIVNETLNTSQQNQEPTAIPTPQYDPANPFGDGWGWWYFSQPQYYTSHIRWIANDLPAGTYVLTYTIQPFAAGEFQVLPAHAWMYYFPDVEGTSTGAVFTITESK
ncbi:MAG TPA: alpha-2-macroglobulin family protein, partial [Longilinea sp.]|nr:alpha-2-macroglobulin family protein [Longilinea sp.]